MRVDGVGGWSSNMLASSTHLRWNWCCIIARSLLPIPIFGYFNLSMCDLLSAALQCCVGLMKNCLIMQACSPLDVQVALSIIQNLKQIYILATISHVALTVSLPSSIHHPLPLPHRHLHFPFHHPKPSAQASPLHRDPRQR
jgi:hypothetical protein